MNKKFLLLSFVLLLWVVQPKVVQAVCVPSQDGSVFTVNENCAFSGTVDGVDAGEGTANTAKLQVSGATLTIGNVQSIGVGSFEAVNGGEIVIPTGGLIYIGKPLWLTDADNDGYPGTTTKILADAQPANALRFNAVSYPTTADSNDSERCAAADTPSTEESALYGTTCRKCVDGALAYQTASEDLYSQCSEGVHCNGSGACTCSEDGAVCTENSDCCTGSCTSFYIDNDEDTYGTGDATKRCGTAYAGYVTNNTDCNDADAAQYSNTQSTGGTITTSGGYRIHTFTSSGTFTPYCLSAVEALVVAGGGGGGGSYTSWGGGGGGGGGGVRYDATKAVTAKSGVTVTVGAGGNGGAMGGLNTEVCGFNGSNSAFGTLSATGGGGGGDGHAYVPIGKSGGSGGGTGYSAYAIASGGSGTAGQGYDGAGNGYVSGTGGAGGGGGGGAGAAASRLAPSNNGGAGGAGAAYSISGSSVYYAGGGGGGGFMTTGGAGGNGGGGAGGSNGGAAGSGTANRGGGGGGGFGGNYGSHASGNGGSGVVIVRYAL